MDIIGYIAVGLFALVGLVLATAAVGEYIAVQYAIFASKVSKEVEVRKEHIAENAELKKARLAKKREVNGAIADRKLELKLEKTKAAASAKFGGIDFSTHNKEQETKQEPIA